MGLLAADDSGRDWPAPPTGPQPRRQRRQRSQRLQPQQPLQPWQRQQLYGLKTGRLGNEAINSTKTGNKAHIMTNAKFPEEEEERHIRDK